MADISDDESDESSFEMESLYEICLNVISSEFHNINKRYVKDLPKHVLEHIVVKLSPFHLEATENEGYLHLRGISTDLLWEHHFTNRFTQSNIVIGALSMSQESGYWKVRYFEKHFLLLIHALAQKDGCADELNKELYRPVQQTNFHLTGSFQPDCDDVLNICIKHLSRLRLSHNATCIYLAKHPDLLLKLAPVLEHFEMTQLHEHGIEALIHILDVLLDNKLKSFSLCHCKVEDIEKLGGLFKTLSKSQSMDASTPLGGQSIFEDDKSTISLDSLDDELEQEDSNWNIAENTALCSSECNSSAKNDTTYNNKDVGKVGRSNKHWKKLHENDQPEDTTCLATDDDLYDDIFSESATSEGACSDKDTLQTEWKLEPSNQFGAHGLTHLQLRSCLFIRNNADCKVFSEELRSFCRLRFLELSANISGDFPAVNDVVASIKELVFHGSLRHLLYENDEKISKKQVEMFCDMLAQSCEGCRTTIARKGLWTLQLAGSIVENTDMLGEALGVCSFCEERVSPSAKQPCVNSKHLDTSLAQTYNQEKNKEKVIKCDDQQSSASGHIDSMKGGTNSMGHRYITSGVETLYITCSKVNSTYKSLAKSLSRNRSIRHLHISSYSLRMNNISLMFDAISGSDSQQCNTSIKKLELRDNVFETVQNGSLRNLIARSHLVYLDLSYCEIEVISDDVVLALSSNKFLEVLQLVGNRLGDAGVYQLSKVFASDKKTSVLHTLGLSCNRVSSSSLVHLANVLTTWPRKLREIAVNDNPLGEYELVRDCLENVFDSVLLSSCDGTMVYADYISEM